MVRSGPVPFWSLLVEGWGQFWPACQELEDILTWLLDLEEEEICLPPLKPILLLVLDLSTADVVVGAEAAALGRVPVYDGPCGLWGLLALSGPLGLAVLTLLVALLGWLMTPCWEC